MKSIEQLLALKKNPYYQFTPEEAAALEVFLSKKPAKKTQQKNNGKKSEKNIPATVLNKNIVKKETGEIPTVDNVVKGKSSETEAVEEIVHPDAIK
tara:strand:+ start:333 stop:620 length:288 start_codon:yes stop_codon:yes gene_type:complete